MCLSPANIFDHSIASPRSRVFSNWDSKLSKKCVLSDATRKKKKKKKKKN
jgi:hypothetical protein